MADRLRIATYNIHGAVGLDRRFEPARTAEVIRETEADVVGLQEVDSRKLGTGGEAMLEYLATHTGLQGVAGPTIYDSRGHYGNALLTRFPVLHTQRIVLDVPAREPRGAIEVGLDVRGLRVRVIATHFGLGRVERRFQIGALLRRLRAHDGPLVLVGDWNEWFGWGATLRQLSRELGTHPAPRTFPARWPVLALDRIWVRPRGMLEALSVHRSRTSQVASDHLPLVAAVRIDP